MEKPRGLPKGIYALADSSSAITAFNLNNKFNLFGRKAYLIGTVSKSFAVIDDAPMKKKVVVEKQDSWVKNLVTGLVVTAALAACAVFVVATGGVGLGAVMLIGAAVGAGAVTTVVAVNDYKSGQARSYGELLQLLNKWAGVGACAGAVVYGGWTLAVAIPDIAVAGGSAAPMLTEKVMSFMMKEGNVTFNGGVVSISLERSMDWIFQVSDLVQSLAATAGTIFLWKTAVDLIEDVMVVDSSTAQGDNNITIEEELEGIAGEYGYDDISEKNYGKCDIAAAEMKEYLQRKKKKAKTIILTWNPPIGYIWSDIANKVAGDNGMHMGVKYENIVYCNIHPTGLLKSVWINDFNQMSGKKSVQEISF